MIGVGWVGVGLFVVVWFERFASTVPDAASPLDVRRGSAAPAARNEIEGLGPWFGLAPTFLGPKAVPGAEPDFISPSPARQSLAAHRAAKPQQNY